MFTQVCTCWPLSLLYRSALRDILGWEAAERGMEWTAGGAQSALVVGGGGGGGEGGWTWPGCWPCPAGRWLTCSRRGWWRGQSPASCCSADSCSCQSGTPTQSWSSALIRLSTEKESNLKGPSNEILDLHLFHYLNLSGPLANTFEFGYDFAELFKFEF